jgi:hypothetical protein
MKEQILQAVDDVWRHHCAALDDALGEVIDELNNLLVVDEYHRHGHDPDQLDRALGPLAAASLDVGSLSRVLGQSTRSRVMAPERLERVQKLIPTLGEMKEAWSAATLGSACVDINEAESPIRERAEAHFKELAQVFRALRIAQLEIRSKYDTELHDTVFASFDWRQLGPGELRLCPPFVVMARLDGDDGKRLREVMELLETGMPMKVVAMRSSCEQLYPAVSGTRVPPKMTIETLPLAMRGIYFVQTSTSDPEFRARLLESLGSPRAAVISVFCKRQAEDQDAFQRRAERAVRARAFPVCVYDPDRESRFVLCFDISANPSPESPWTTQTLTGNDEQGQPVELEEPFTFAHFAASEPGFVSELSDPPDPAAGLVPLTDYLGLSRPEQVGKLPFVSLAGPDKVIVRKVVSARIALQCAERLHLWRTLQEIAGVDNPYVSTARATLEKKLGDQQREQLENMRQEFEKDAAQRQKAAVISAVRKLVTRLTGVDPGDN